MESIEVFGDPIVVQIGPLPVTHTALTSLGVTCALIAIAALVRRHVVRGSSNWIAEIAMLGYEQLDGLVNDIVGRPNDQLTVFSGSLFLFIASCNLSGQLPGVTPPTGNLVVTSALAAVVFAAVPVSGIASRGIKRYLADYLRPNPLMLPLHVISELSRTLALSVRLFGNIMSGHLIVALLVALTGFMLPMPLMALDLLIGLLQAYIFALLATVYVGAAIRSEVEE